MAISCFPNLRCGGICRIPCFQCTFNNRWVRYVLDGFDISFVRFLKQFLAILTEYLKVDKLLGCFGAHFWFYCVLGGFSIVLLWFYHHSFRFFHSFQKFCHHFWRLFTVYSGLFISFWLFPVVSTVCYSFVIIFWCFDFTFGGFIIVYFEYILTLPLYSAVWHSFQIF